MKKRVVTLIITIALSLFCFLPASAQVVSQDGVSLTLPDGYAVLNKDNLSKNAALIESLGYTQKSAAELFESDGLICYCLSPDGKRSVQIRKTETDFSRELYDLSLLSEDDAYSVAEKVVPTDKNVTYALADVNDMTLYEVKAGSSDSGGRFCNIQYVTIRGGQLYSIAFFDSAETVSDEFSSFAWDAICTLSIPESRRVSASETEGLVEVVIVWALIALAAGVAVFLLVSLIREISRERRIVIPRRKIKK